MSNVLDQIKAAEAAKLRALSTLHSELGYASAQDLAAAILGASGTSRSAAPRAPKTPKAGSTPTGASRKGRRIDEETKRQVVAALKSGQPGARVAKQFGVSYPTIHNWKTELGLVKPRSGGRKSKRN